MWKLVSAVVAATVTVMGLSATAHADCLKDADCKGDRICDQGRCRSPSSSTPLPPAPPAAIPPVAGPLVVLTPPDPAVSVIPKRHHNADMMVAGIVLTSVATLSAVVGAVLVGVDQGNSGGADCVPDTDFCDGGGLGTTGQAGLGLIAGSVVLAAIGIPLWVIGGRGDVARLAAVPRPGFFVSPPSGGVATKTGTLTWSF